MFLTHKAFKAQGQGSKINLKSAYSAALDKNGRNTRKTFRSEKAAAETHCQVPATTVAFSFHLRVIPESNAKTTTSFHSSVMVVFARIS